MAIEESQLVLSIFPGIDLLGSALEAEGFCVVRGPDTLWGGDIRRFHPPAGKFFGVIGGPPCQDFSRARRLPPTGKGRRMLAQFARVVREARCEWWLMENVASCPNVTVRGWSHQRLDMNQGWYSGISRLRHIQFGSRSGRVLDIPRGKPVRGAEPAALACDDRSLAEVCRLQGLPEDFDLPPFRQSEKIRAVGNGVPLVMGRVLALAIHTAYGGADRGSLAFDGKIERRRCACGCGRRVTPRATYHDATCRKRAQRARETRVES